MLVSDVLTPLMDKARKLSGLTDKLNIIDLTKLMDHFDLHINPNLLSKTEWTAYISKGYEMWSNVQVFPLKPGTYTLSWQAKTSGQDKYVRIRIQDFDKNVTCPGFNVLGEPFKLTLDRQNYTFTIPKDDNHYTLALYGSGPGLVKQNAPVKFYNVKLEHGDLATPLTKLGGVAKALLCAMLTVRGCAA